MLTKLKKNFNTMNKLSHERVLAIGILVFLMNFVPPLIKITGERYPTGVELINSFLIGLLQVAIILYSLLERKKEGEENVQG